MNTLRIPSLFLAAALQFLPVCRTVLTSPAVTSNFAIILRWGIAAAAALGTYDSVSGASQVYVTSPNSTTGYVGQPFSFTITLGGEVGSDPGAKINAGPLPTGLTNQTFDYYNHNPPEVYSVISGIPVTPVNNQQVFIVVTHPSYSGSVTTNLYITILAAPSGPQINTQPAGVTNVAGSTASFSVDASPVGSLGYQWRFNDVNVPSATTNPLVLTSIRTSQIGEYSVVVTESGASVTSSPAPLLVTLPTSPEIKLLSQSSNQFVFSFEPVVGLTNMVETNALIAGGDWGVLTNIPPPVSTSSVSVTTPINGNMRFHRVRIDP